MAEETRFNLLRTACHNNDYFYIAFHQILCLWFADREFLKNVVAQPGQNDKVLDRGMCHMTQFLMQQKAAPVAAKHGKWFTTFPTEFDHLRRYSDAYKQAVYDVSISLILITQHINRFLLNCTQRGYPPLADEIIGIFRAPSPIIQRLIFTWIRHHMGIPHDEFAEAMLQEFQQSQNFNAQLSARINTNMPPTQRELEDASKYTRSQYMLLRSQQEAKLKANGTYQPLAQSVQLQQPIVQMPGQLSPMMGQIQHQRPLTIVPQTSAQNMASAGLQPPSVLQQQQLLQAQGQAERRPSSVVSHHSGAARDGLINSPIAVNSSRLTPHQSPSMGGRPFISASANQSRQNSFSVPAQNIVPSDAPGPTPQFHPHQQYQQQQSQRNQALQQAAYLPQHSHILNAQEPRSNLTMVRPPPGGYQPQPINNNGPPRRASSQQPFYPPANAQPRAPHIPDPDRTALTLANHREAILKPIDRVPEDKGKPADRYYQTVKRFIIGPTVLGANHVDTYELLLDEDDISRFSEGKQYGPTDPEVREVKHGSHVYRFRTVELPHGQKEISHGDLAIADTTWPPHVSIESKDGEGNPVPLSDLRRKQHFGKDLPYDITPHLRGFFKTKDRKQEMFHLAVVMSRPADKASQQANYAFAVEEIEVLRHDIVREQVLNARIPFAEVEAGIKALLSPSEPDDDDDIVMAPADLTISMACPFSAKMWKTPVKGVNCLHRECFDLDTWLETRPEIKREKGVIFYSKRNGGAFVGGVDVWRCPLCRGDARPQMLRVDEWMMAVREKIVADGKEDEARDILVSQDGSWKIKPEVIADRGNLEAEKKKEEEKKKKKVVEVIDLDDD